MRFRIEATWKPGPTVELQFYRSEPLTDEQAQHLIESGMLKPGDRKAAWRDAGTHEITELRDMLEKRVETIALDWLKDNAGADDGDTYIINLANEDIREEIERLEAAISAGR